MATIPVPVHFDGHNINIITEDAPATRKCWSKSGNLAKRKPRPKIPACAHGEPYIQNLSMPLNSPSNKENCVSTSTEEGDGDDTSPPHTPEPPPNRPKRKFSPQTPGSSENDLESTIQSEHNGSQALPRAAQDTSKSPHKYNPLAEAFTPSGGLPARPPQSVQPAANINSSHVNAQANSRRPTPMCPRVPVGHGQNGHHGRGQAMGGRGQARGRPGGAGGAGADTKQVTNDQLIKMGLDPAEFGSHDDVGFEQEDRSNKDRQSLYKTELCREWSTSGWCYYNKRCSFAHGLHELRPVFRSKKWRTKRCRNWHTTGYCPYEHRCQFLHDQSPPRRMQDYTAVQNPQTGAVGVVDQPKQPVYFHYKVDCDRKDAEKGDTADNADEGEDTETGAQGQEQKARRVMMHKVNKDDRDQGKNKFTNPKYPEMNMAPRQRAQQQREQRERQSAIQRAAERSRAKKKRQIKDTVITPFNPTVPPIMQFNPMAPLTPNPMALNPAMAQMAMGAVPGVGGVGVAGSVAGSVVSAATSQHPAPIGVPSTPSLFMPALPPSIDPNVYLNLTPSPGTVPVSAVSLKAGDEPVEAVQQQLELKLSEQQQKLQEMSQKVRDAADRRRANHDEALVDEMPLGVAADLEASPECESIGEDLLHSFLPNDPLIDGKKGAKGDEAKDSAKDKKAKAGKRLDPPLLPPPILHLQLSQNSVVNSAANAALTTPTAASPASLSTKLVPMTTAPTTTTPANANATAAATSSVSASTKASPAPVATMPVVSGALRAVQPMTPPSTVAPSTTTHHFHHHYVPAVPMNAQQHAYAHAYAAAHVNHGAYPLPMTGTPGLGPVPPYGAPLGSVPMAGLPGLPMAGMMPVTPMAPMPAAVAPMQYPPLTPASLTGASPTADLAWQYASRHY